jgi:hypothetical protein
MIRILPDAQFIGIPDQDPSYSELQIRASESNIYVPYPEHWALRISPVMCETHTGILESRYGSLQCPRGSSVTPGLPLRAL